MTVGLPRRRSCGTMAVHFRLLSTNLAYLRNRQEIETIAQAAQRGLRSGRTGVTTIPVVVHVVYNPNSPEQNISDAQIQSQIDVLNQDFRATNPDVASVPAPFKSLVGDARIEFALATTDPNGNPTTGIIRKPTTEEAFMDDDRVKYEATGGSDAWPSDRYLNIWVCLLGGGLLGYAQFPGGPDETDGVVVTHTAFGNTGTAAPPFNLGRTTTHEIGHWLNLRHIWGDDGDGCNGSDFVDDTPNQAGPNAGVPTFPRVTCSNGPNGDLFMNYMDYTDDAGMFMFTAGQVARMQSALDVARPNIGLDTPPPPPPAVEGEFYTTDGTGQITLLKKHSGWRKTWNLIVPGQFGGSLFSDLLFYDAAAGEGEFYSTDGSGTLSLLKTYSGWRTTWKTIIPGNFGGNTSTDLFFYDPTTGEGEFYTTDGTGNMTLLKKHSGFRKTWQLIIPGNFGGNVYTDLLFYDPTTGEAEFYTTDGKGNITLLKKHTGWRKTWSLIVPGNFGAGGLTDFLLYDASTGEGEIYITTPGGNITRQAQYKWRQDWKFIVPGLFGGNSYTDLLFYDPAKGEGEFYSTDGRGTLSLLKQYTGWRTSWKLIVPGGFGSNYFTDLLFYDPS